MRSFALGLLACLTVLPATAEAQAIMVTLRGMEGRDLVDIADLSETTRAPVTTAECEANALIQFRFSNVTTSRSQLHFYRGSMCDDVMTRNDTTTETCTDLGLSLATNMMTQVDPDIGVQTLLPDCVGSTSSGVRTIWVLAVNDETADAVTGAGEQVSFPLAFDFAGPSAPTGFTARDGETAATLGWEGSTDEITTYEIFFVENGCDGMGGVTTSAFADPNNPDVTYLVKTVSGTETTTTVTLPAGGTGGQHAVAIRAVDNAGNVGPISEVVCVSQIDVQTFWDEYCGTEGHPACTSSGCSVTPEEPARSSGAPWLLLAPLALIFVRRRIR